MENQNLSHPVESTEKITTIYLIEDDPAIHAFLQETIKARPNWHLIGESYTYQHALSNAARAKADIYLVDLGLPDGRGEDLLALLAEHACSASLLVFTVFGEESRLMDAFHAGATGYVLKGCTKEELVSSIDLINAGGAPITPILARMMIGIFKKMGKMGTLQQEPMKQVPVAIRHHDAAMVEDVLSDREITTLRLVASGYTTAEIADRMKVSESTVKTYIQRMYRKLSIKGKAQAVQYAMQAGMPLENREPRLH